MGKEKIISGLKDLIIDRESFINDNDKENIFAKDKKILEAAVKLIENSIPREVVEEKIEKYKLSGGSNGKDETENQIREFIIEALQELLQEKGE